MAKTNLCAYSLFANPDYVAEFKNINDGWKTTVVVDQPQAELNQQDTDPNRNIIKGEPIVKPGPPKK